MTTIISKILRPLAHLALFSALLLPSQSPAQNFGVNEPSAVGNFLAGRLALYALDTDTASTLLLDASNTQWDNLFIVQRAFGALAADGRIDDATSIARHLLELDPNYSIARLLLGMTALKERRYASAAKELDPIGLEDFVGITAAVLRAWAEVGENNIVAGVAILDDLGSIGLADFLLFHRALMMDVANQPKAIEQMAQAYKRDPFVGNVVEAYVRMLGNEGNFDQAQVVLDEYLSQGLSEANVTQLIPVIKAGRAPGKYAADIPTASAEIFESIGLALARDGAPDIAMVFLQGALYLNPSADKIRISIAQLYEQLDRFDEANRTYEQVRNNSIYASVAIVQLAENLDALGDRPEAIRRLSNIVAREPENLEARAALADKLRFDEQFAESITHYSEILNQVGGNRPRDWIYYYLRGIAYERIENWTAAEKDMLRALDLNPDQPQVLNYLGYSWVDRGENLQQALSMIERAVRANPQDGYIVDSLGWAFYKLERYEEAVIVLEQAARLSSNDPEINDHLGDAYWRVGRQREARFQWEIAREMDVRGTISERATSKLANGLTDELAAQSS